MNIFKSFRDIFRKKKIIKFANSVECDKDGDVVYYKDSYYIVNININFIMRLDNPEEDFLRVFEPINIKR